MKLYTLVKYGLDNLSPNYFKRLTVLSCFFSLFYDIAYFIKFNP